MNVTYCSPVIWAVPVSRVACLHPSSLHLSLLFHLSLSPSSSSSLAPLAVLWLNAGLESETRSHLRTTVLPRWNIISPGRIVIHKVQRLQPKLMSHYQALLKRLGAAAVSLTKNHFACIPELQKSWATQDKLSPHLHPPQGANSRPDNFLNEDTEIINLVYAPSSPELFGDQTLSNWSL